MSWLAKAGAWLKALFGAGDKVAEVAEGAAADRRAATDLATSAGNVAEADRIAAEAGVSPAPPPPFSAPAASEAAPRPAEAPTEEPTPPASPAARGRIPG